MVELISSVDRFGSQVVPSPSQKRALEGAICGLERGDFAVVKDCGSDGKTTVLRHVHRQLRGRIIGVRELVAKLPAYGPEAIEEAFLDLFDEQIADHDLLIVDDLHLVKNVVESCDYVRKGLFDAVLNAALEGAASARKKVLFACDDIPDPLSRRAHSWLIEDFSSEDFAVICSAYLEPGTLRELNFEEIHRFAPSLNAHQLRKAALWLSHEPELTTSCFLDYLSTHNLVSNVEIDDVERVTWSDLKGVDDVIQALEAKIALPFENRELATRLGLKPKRGVLLAGPPGTGKTTIGKALAHRLKGKFFLVDGTVIAGSNSFYDRIDRVFAAASRNAPSVIFIDDADVIFGGDKESGLYRYLLTKLDGLESASSGRVCVIMTAMEPADLPMAMLRSGRVELWLETRLPDFAARVDILRDHFSALPSPLCDMDIAQLALASDGMTGADLKAIFEDGKLLLAHDQATGNCGRPAEAYFLDATAAIRQNRRNYRKRRQAQLTDSQRFGYKAS